MFLGFLAAMAVAWRHRCVQPAVRRQLRAARGRGRRRRSSSRVGLVDDLHELSPPAKVTGMVVAGARARLLRRHDVLLPGPVPRRGGARPGLHPARDRAVAHRAWPTPSTSSTGSTAWPPASSPSRRARSSSTASTSTSAACSPPPTSARSSPSSCWASCLGLPAPQLQPGPHLHGRLRRPAARPADGGVDERRRRPGRSEPGLRGQTYFFFAPLFIPLLILGVPLLDTVFAVDPSGHAAARASPRPTRTTCTTG